MQVRKQEKIDLYRLMVRIRAFEEQSFISFNQGLTYGVLHLYIGEEAIAAGCMYDLRKEDYITSTHRGHGHLIAKGADMGRMFAELLGKETGYCRGRGGSMHIADMTIGILGANGIVGAGVPISVGAAFALRYKGLDHVVLCFFGDATINTGAFHEAVNLASTWKLPVVFVCENNLYGISVSIKNACALRSLADRSAGYAIPGVCVDGNDVLAVRKACIEATARARKGEGPTLLECQTYRWGGHFTADDGKYRPDEEVRHWKEERDPIGNLARDMLGSGEIDQQEIDVIHREVKEEVEKAFRYAQESNPADVDGMLRGVYYESPTRTRNSKGEDLP
ncbi:MAG: thiamine pyrophosphate-dependent dehydrogenase E1 component subunit alpha [Deltaproteobacteria bacterium]|nr:thiamine pyrophosphate-dependent dehydrogenase E1 component subunit alpha [Deltaproteobacteria bacterium]